MERRAGIDPLALEPLLVQVLGSRPDSLERVATGVSTVVCRATLRDTVFYIRLAEEEGEDLAVDAAVMNELRARGVKVPEVIHVETFVPSVSRSLMITAEVPGAPVSGIGTEATRAVIRDAGRDLAVLNQLPINGFGWVRRDGLRWPPVGELASYESFVTSGLPDPWPGRFADLFDHQTLEVLAATVSRAATRYLRQPTFAHGDFDVSHIFCLNDRYTGLIDFGEMRGAEPTFDLGTFLWANPQAVDDGLLAALIDGYGSAAPVPGDLEDMVRSAVLHGLTLLGRWISPGFRLARPVLPAARRVASLLNRL
ncbi:MAG: aminoglycoside phosphotransferase family protein [Dehalococcoidia bacterium]